MQLKGKKSQSTREQDYSLSDFQTVLKDGFPLNFSFSNSHPDFYVKL